MARIVETIRRGAGFIVITSIDSVNDTGESTIHDLDTSGKHPSSCVCGIRSHRVVRVFSTPRLIGYVHGGFLAGSVLFSKGGGTG